MNIHITLSNIVIVIIIVVVFIVVVVVIVIETHLRFLCTLQ